MKAVENSFCRKFWQYTIGIGGIVIALFVFINPLYAATPQAGIFLANGTLVQAFPQVAAGSSVAIGDVNADGTDEIVIGSPPGNRATITIWTQGATLLKTIYPYASNMKSGIHVAVGDVTGNGSKEIIVCPRTGDSARILRFTYAGKQMTRGFYAFPSRLKIGGTLALGDVDGNGVKEIIVGAGPGDAPDVNVFNQNGNKIGVLSVFEKKFRGGVMVSSLDVDGDTKDDIIVGPYSGRSSDVIAYQFPSKKTLSNFRAYGTFRGGVTLSANTSGTGKRILVGAGKTGGAHVRQFNLLTNALDGVNVFPIGTSWRGGITVAFLSYTDSVKFFASPGATSLTLQELVKLGAATQEVFIGNTNFSYDKRAVTASSGIFSTHIVRVNLKNSKLKLTSLVSTTNTNCFNLPCGVKSLRSYLDEAKGTIAINGSYFCPSDYSWCRGQAGSFFWLWYNTRTGIFTNSYQNQFNNGPVVALDEQNHFYYYNPAKDWQGKSAFESTTHAKLRAAFSCGPNLIFEGKVTVRSSDLDTKQLTVKSNRSGIGFRGDDMYLVVATGATVIDLGNIMKALGMQYATNLDGGGSSALIFEGQYKIGPGRNLPNALVIGE